jgi:hypothetical protein
MRKDSYFFIILAFAETFIAFSQEPERVEQKIPYTKARA